MNALIEGLKEFARMVLIAVIPVVIVNLESDTVDWRLVGMAVLIAALRAIDRWVHEEPSIKATGLVPF